MRLRPFVLAFQLSRFPFCPFARMNGGVAIHSETTCTFVPAGRRRSLFAELRNERSTVLPHWIPSGDPPAPFKPHASAARACTLTACHIFKGGARGGGAHVSRKHQEEGRQGVRDRPSSGRVLVCCMPPHMAVVSWLPDPTLSSKRAMFMLGGYGARR